LFFKCCSERRICKKRRIDWQCHFSLPSCNQPSCRRRRRNVSLGRTVDIVSGSSVALILTLALFARLHHLLCN